MAVGLEGRYPPRGPTRPVTLRSASPSATNFRFAKIPRESAAIFDAGQARCPTAAHEPAKPMSWRNG
jgi:hypothetical protein